MSVRTQPCSDADARTRLSHARKFLEVAELAAAEGNDVEYATVATALAVLAGIAASDAACCASLRVRARGRDHREAATLLQRIEPSGRRAASSLERLIALKDEAHYGLADVSRQSLRSGLRRASELVAFAAAAMEAEVRSADAPE